MRRLAVTLGLILLIAVVGCCKKYETALADLSASVTVLEASLNQTMDMANKAGEAAGEKEPLYDQKDRDARIRTCWEMKALIYTTLLGKEVKYELPTKDAPGKLFYEEDGKQVPVDTKGGE